MQYCVYSMVTSILQEEKKELDEITAKRQKRGRIEDEVPGEEKTILHSNLNICLNHLHGTMCLNILLLCHLMVTLNLVYVVDYLVLNR